MAFIVPSGSFDTGSPVLGALTGLTHGLAQGIQDRSRMDAVQQELALRAQDQALRERAYAHGLQNEAQQQEYYGSMGKLLALGAQQSIGAPVQGPPTPAQPQLGAGEQGPMPQQAAQLPPDQSAWLSQAMDIGSHIKDPKALEAFHAEVSNHLAQNAIATHQQRIISEIKDTILQGQLHRLGPGGAVDESATEAANALLQTAQNVSPENPQEAAAILDKIDQGIGQLKIETAQHNTKMAMRGHTLEALDAGIASNKAANLPVNEAQAVRDLYESGVIDNEQLGKMWPDAKAGTLAIKNQVLQQRAEADQLRAENEAQRLEIQRLTEEAKTPRRLGEIAAQGEEARKTEDLKNQLKRDRPPAPASVGERAHAISAISGVLKSEFPMHGLPNESDQDKAAYAEREKSLRADSGLDEARTNGKLSLPGKQPSSVVLQDIKKRAKAEGWDKARILEEFKKAGIDPNAPAPQ